LYLTSPSDEGDNLTQTLHTFLVRYVAPQTIFWNQSEILTGRLRIPDIERHFPANRAYDPRRKELRLDADEMMSRMKRRVDGSKRS
jgi:hypothetical protein